MPKTPTSPPHWAPGVVESEVSRSAVTLLALGNLTSDQRAALFGVLSARPGARTLGDVSDAIGRHGVGVALALPRATPPKLPAGVRKPTWPPPAWLAERTQVFLSTGSVAALGDRP